MQFQVHHPISMSIVFVSFVLLLQGASAAPQPQQEQGQNVIYDFYTSILDKFKDRVETTSLCLGYGDILTVTVQTTVTSIRTTTPVLDPSTMTLATTTTSVLQNQDSGQGYDKRADASVTTLKDTRLVLDIETTTVKIPASNDPNGQPQTCAPFTASSSSSSSAAAVVTTTSATAGDAKVAMAKLKLRRMGGDDDVVSSVVKSATRSTISAVCPMLGVSTVTVTSTTTTYVAQAGGNSGIVHRAIALNTDGTEFTDAPAPLIQTAVADYASFSTTTTTTTTTLAATTSYIHGGLSKFSFPTQIPQASVSTWDPATLRSLKASKGPAVKNLDATDPVTGFLGFFLASKEGNYTFTSTSNPNSATYAWTGDEAYSAWDKSNAKISQMPGGSQAAFQASLDAHQLVLCFFLFVGEIPGSINMNITNPDGIEVPVSSSFVPPCSVPSFVV